MAKAAVAGEERLLDHGKDFWQAAGRPQLSGPIYLSIHSLCLPLTK
jgi:hypothetical protein